MALHTSLIRKLFPKPFTKQATKSTSKSTSKPMITLLRQPQDIFLPGAWRGTLLALLLQVPLAGGIQAAQVQTHGFKRFQTNAATQGPRTAVFAGGCFWGIEAVFEHVRGVTDVVSGYAGGSSKNPSYEQVSSGQTGHAEAVRISFDPKRISYEQLLAVFLTVAHNPTELNRQGPDVGSQYRSAIFYGDASQKQAATRVLAQLQRSHAYPRPLVTQVLALRGFHLAEAYHQNYLALHPTNPYIVSHDLPKLAQLRQRFPTLYRALP